jgi:predicted Zn-dependent peptidase
MIFVPYDMGDVVCVALSFDVGMDTHGDLRTAQLAHYVEHLCATFTEDEQRSLMLASVFHNAWTDDKVTCYYAVGFVDAVVETWLPLVLRGVTTPVLTDKTLRVEAVAACTELKLAMQDPTLLLEECIAGVETPYSGWCDTAAQVEFLDRVANAPPNQIRKSVLRFIRRHYKHPHVMVVAAARHREMIDSFVVKIGHKQMLIAAHDATMKTGFKYGVKYTVAASGTTAHIEVRVALRDTDEGNLDVESECVSSLLQHALFTELRSAMGAVYDVRVGAIRHACTKSERASGRYRAWICVRTSCDAVRVEEIIDAILTKASKFEADVTKIESWRRTKYVSNQSNPASVVDLVTGWVRASAEQMAIETPEQQIRAVTQMTDASVHKIIDAIRTDVESGLYVIYCAVP